jgi:hypothetical protein
MYIKLFTIIFAGLLMTGNALAGNQIKSAMSAAPASVSANAKVIDWDFKTLREGNNGWTCLPDRPDTPERCVKETTDGPVYPIDRIPRAMIHGVSTNPGSTS